VKPGGEDSDVKVCALAKKSTVENVKKHRKDYNCTATEPLRGYNFERVSEINNEEKNLFESKVSIQHRPTPHADAWGNNSRVGIPWPSIPSRGIMLLVGNRDKLWLAISWLGYKAQETCLYL
jgi:hypothetical protein